MKAVAILALALLVAIPAADALDIGARALKARQSDDYTDTAWGSGYYGCGVTIAVFDEGVDDKHPYLDGKVVAGKDTTHTEDVQNVLFPNNPQPLQGTHGTPVAGLATGHGGYPFYAPEDAPSVPDNALIGVAPCAYMVDVMFYDTNYPLPGREDLITDMVQAFEWAIDNRDNDWGDNNPENDGIDVITMSWSPLDGTNGTDVLSQAANKAVEAGIVVLGSMGNSGTEVYIPWGTPAAADLTLGIAALFDGRTVDRSDDVVIDYSTRGPRPDDGDDNPYEELKPDVASPAHDVVGPADSDTDGTEYQVFGCEDTTGAEPECDRRFGGTSAATPMTAGVVALMLQANPALTPAEIKEILHQTAEVHPDYPPTYPHMSGKYNYSIGYGMTDAYAATLMATQWPGMELGKDTDADGVRDFIDEDPYNATLNVVVRNATAQAVGGMIDTDGDGIVDQDDPDPLAPESYAVQEGEVATPGIAMVLLVAALLCIALLARRT